MVEYNNRICVLKWSCIYETCVYCNHCQPCPAGIDIGLVNKYYDLALAGDTIAANHYTKLSVNAKACLHCGHCECGQIIVR